MNKPRQPALTSDGVVIAQRYWRECKRRVFPASFDVMGGNPTYSGATMEEVARFNEWYDANVPATEAAP